MPSGAASTRARKTMPSSTSCKYFPIMMILSAGEGYGSAKTGRGELLANQRNWKHLKSDEELGSTMIVMRITLRPPPVSLNSNPSLTKGWRDPCVRRRLGTMSEPTPTGRRSRMNSCLRVLGIDPASAGPTGFGIVESNGGRCSLVHYGALKVAAKRQKE